MPLAALVIVKITLNVTVRQNAPKCPLNNGMSIVQNFFATGGNNIVEVFESLTTGF